MLRIIGYAALTALWAVVAYFLVSGFAGWAATTIVGS
jgi:hypothetical protein